MNSQPDTEILRLCREQQAFGCRVTKAKGLLTVLAVVGIKGHPIL